MKTPALIILILTFNALALTPEAEKGKTAIAACMSCHNAELIPQLAPPFYGVQNKYKKVYENKQDFIKSINAWAKKPTQEKALMQRPIKILGLMPPMPLPDDMLNNIGAYIYEENFGPPCKHWANDLKNDTTANMKTGKGKGMGSNHDAMIRMKYQQLCQ